MQSYYRWHAVVYDATRWTFLFGRNAILQKMVALNPGTVLEVGCGTGRNLKRLAGLMPDVQLVGVDVSSDMLKRATRASRRFSRRVLLFERAYKPDAQAWPVQPDAILFSYALTMFNPGAEEALDRALSDLPADGMVAVVDFHDTPFPFFRWWMGKNHVRMEGHLAPMLEKRFVTREKVIVRAWFGLWRYILYIGVKRNPDLMST
ncbi:MAG: class I SAM-dependent methyltransferase [Saprospiraceae bacterium]|nr:class I SAM-dependent methyltransferase [Saprospiraceae bacterium]MCC6413190.1 class I SAM-dependent methyltransferase [Saprospiraceae bacterium]